eukprot:jgi/Botrbrau1/22571/Bobra.176_1s0004.4
METSCLTRLGGSSKFVGVAACQKSPQRQAFVFRVVAERDVVDPRFNRSTKGHGRSFQTSVVVKARGGKGPTSDNLFDRFLASVRPGFKSEAPEVSAPTPPIEAIPVEPPKPAPAAKAPPPPVPVAEAPAPAPAPVVVERRDVKAPAVSSNGKPATSGLGIDIVLTNNRKWATAVTSAEPDYFLKLANQQAPEFLWMGCADSRVPANQILGLAPGEVFVHRNVGNLVTHKDMNAMAALEFSVDVLQVKHIIICGHYNCGAVKGALTLPAKEKGLVNLWISDIRDVRNRHEGVLKGIDNFQAKWDRLCELNVVRQMYNVATSPTVQSAWERNQKVHIHAYVYSLGDGLLKVRVSLLLHNPAMWHEITLWVTPPPPLVLSRCWAKKMWCNWSGKLYRPA